MLLSHCPNCQHDNKPGERFCAACGVPLDLKPCPVCGKVDSVKATVCAGCGAHFPPLSSGPYLDESGTHEGAPEVAVPSMVSPPRSTMRALPLIIVALAAGGIPMLWLYRNAMPVPKAWQPQGAIVETPSSAPPVVVVPPAPTPSARLESGSQPAPEGASAISTPALIPLPLPTNPPAAADVRPPVSDHPVAPKGVPPANTAPVPAAQSKPAVAPYRPPVAAKPKVKPAARPAQPAAAPAAATECTEALIAVGLCEPKAGK